MNLRLTKSDKESVSRAQLSEIIYNFEPLAVYVKADSFKF